MGAAQDINHRTHDSMVSRSFCCCCIAVATVALASSARGEQATLEDALGAYSRGELDQALEGFELALSRGGNSADQLVDIHVHLGVLRGASGDVDAARRAFEVALALDPMLSAPAELGGQLRSVFDDIRGARSGRRMAMSLRIIDETSVELVVTSAPLGLVSTLQIRALSPENGQELWSRPIDGAGPATLALPGDLWQGDDHALVTLVAEAQDRYGNTFARGQVELQRPEEERPQEDEVVPDQTLTQQQIVDNGNEEQQERRRRFEWYQHPALWVVVGLVVAGGVATGVVLGTRDDADRYMLGAPQVR